MASRVVSFTAEKSENYRKLQVHESTHPTEPLNVSSMLGPARPTTRRSQRAWPWASRPPPDHVNAPRQGERPLWGRVAMVTMDRQGLDWRLQPQETAAERTSLGNSRKARGRFPGVLEGKLVTGPVSGSDRERAHQYDLVPVEPSSVNHLQRSL